MLFHPKAMHIPDGFLTPAVAAVGWALAVLLILAALRQTQRQLGERQVPLMGVLAAFIFAAQAINFPVAAGTSGHLMGGALAAIVLGPWAATLIMTAVIAVQGLLFQDGGLLVMGWNILNMGVFTAFSGYFVYRLVQRVAGSGGAARMAGAFAGAWVSVEVGATATAVELAVSGTSPLSFALPAMAAVHALIGVGEGLITAGALASLTATRPEVVRSGEVAPGRRGAGFVLVGLLVALLVAALSPLASPHPDGLEAVAQAQGFLSSGRSAPYEILPGYLLPSIDDPAAATLAAVGLGTLLVFVVAVIVGRVAARRTIDTK
jgi:cobalt/nickel transport system permease protein